MARIFISYRHTDRNHAFILYRLEREFLQPGEAQRERPVGCGD